jgi:beta-mannanase
MQIGAYTSSAGTTSMESIVAAGMGYYPVYISDYEDCTDHAKMSASNYPWSSWAAAIPAGTGMVSALNLLCTGNPSTSGAPGGADGTASAQCSALLAGTYDTEYQSVLSYISSKASAGKKNIIRLGHEMNGGTMCWGTSYITSALATSLGYGSAGALFAALFQHVSTLVHEYSNLLVCWNPVLNSAYSVDVTPYWPGIYNSISNTGGADIMGIDIYPQLYCTTAPNPNETNFPAPSGYYQYLLAQAYPFTPPGSGLNYYGLKWYVGYANYLGVPLMLPEFGIWAAASSFPAEGGTGDDAYWIAQVAAWAVANNVGPVIVWCYQSGFNLFSGSTAPLSTAQVEVSFQGSSTAVTAVSGSTGPRAILV